MESSGGCGNLPSGGRGRKEQDLMQKGWENAEVRAVPAWEEALFAGGEGGP